MNDEKTTHPPDLDRMNELIKQAHSGSDDGRVELAKLVEDGILYWQQQSTGNINAEQQAAFVKFNQMHQYIARHQLPGIDKALYGG
jgi:hypothetical protein